MRSSCVKMEGRLKEDLKGEHQVNKKRRRTLSEWYRQQWMGPSVGGSEYISLSEKGSPQHWKASFIDKNSSFSVGFNSSTALVRVGWAQTYFQETIELQLAHGTSDSLCVDSGSWMVRMRGNGVDLIFALKMEVLRHWCVVPLKPLHLLMGTRWLMAHLPGTTTLTCYCVDTLVYYMAHLLQGL